MIKEMHEIVSTSYEGKRKISIFDITIVNDIPMMQKFTMRKVKDFSRIEFLRERVLNNPEFILLDGKEDYNFCLHFKTLVNGIRGTEVITPHIIVPDEKIIVSDSVQKDNKLVIAELEKLKWAIKFIDCIDKERVVMQAFGESGVSPDVIRTAFDEMFNSLRFSSNKCKYSSVDHAYTGMYKAALKSMK